MADDDKYAKAWEKRRLRYGPGGHTHGDDFLWKSIDHHKGQLMKGGYFVALGDTEMAVVWFEPECGAKWKIRSMLGGVRLGHDLREFHSWCSIAEMHKFHNQSEHPEYYMTPSEITKLKQNG